MSVIAFDFDGVLDDPKMQKFCRKLKSEGNEIWIVTARSDNDFNKSKILNKIGISEYMVLYAGNKSKVPLLESITADLYIDNITKEFFDIQNHTKTIPVLFNI